jgi:transposase InsO family protein
MGTEITLRKKAIKLWLRGMNKSEIARRLQKPRLWVQRWTARYDPSAPEASLQDHSCAPSRTQKRYSDRIRDMVVRSRQERETGKHPRYSHALIGAEAIHYELRELGIAPLPSARTIHAWLKQAGLVRERKKKVKKQPNSTYPVLVCQAVNDVHEMDLKGPFYLKGSAQKHYLATLRDVYGKKVSVAALMDMKMETIIDFLVTSWQKLGKPKRLQMDNGLEFRGSNRYPRALGKLVQVCLDLGVTPVFIPTHEPWRNGVIENLNGLVDRLLLHAQQFETDRQLQRATRRLETSINTTHRLPALDGKTPREFASQAPIRPVLVDYDWRKRDLRMLKGKVSYIRLVRKSGRITLAANDKFLIGKKYKWQYVLACVDVRTKTLKVYLKNKLIKSFDYS